MVLVTRDNTMVPRAIIQCTAASLNLQATHFSSHIIRDEELNLF